MEWLKFNMFIFIFFTQFLVTDSVKELSKEEIQVEFITKQMIALDNFHYDIEIDKAEAYKTFSSYFIIDNKLSPFYIEKVIKILTSIESYLKKKKGM